jgi:hypothetical protein
MQRAAGPVGAREIFPLRDVQTGSGAQWVPGVLETDSSPPSIAEIKNSGALPSRPHISSCQGGYVAMQFYQRFGETFCLLLHGINVGRDLTSVVSQRAVIFTITSFRPSNIASLV